MFPVPAARPTNEQGREKCQAQAKGSSYFAPSIPTTERSAAGHSHTPKDIHPGTMLSLGGPFSKMGPIADFAGCEGDQAAYLAEALQYRPRGM